MKKSNQQPTWQTSLSGITYKIKLDADKKIRVQCVTKNTILHGFQKQTDKNLTKTEKGNKEFESS